MTSRYNGLRSLRSLKPGGVSIALAALLARLVSTSCLRPSSQEGVAVWFRTLSLIISAALLGKAAIALAVPRRFYSMRERQYATESQPFKLMVAPVIVTALTLAAWYATIFHYQP